MSYPKVSKGLRYVFLSEIIELVAAVIAVVLTSLIKTVPATVSTLVDVVISTGSLVLCIYGLSFAKDEEQGFSDAFGLTLGVLVANAVLNIMGLFITNFKASTSFGDMLLVVSNLMIVHSIRKMYIGVGDIPAAKTAQNVLIFFAIYFAILLAGAFLAIIAVSSNVGQIITLIVLLAGAICALIAYIMYLILLNKAARDFA